MVRCEMRKELSSAVAEVKSKPNKVISVLCAYYRAKAGQYGIYWLTHAQYRLFVIPRHRAKSPSQKQGIWLNPLFESILIEAYYLPGISRIPRRGDKRFQLQPVLFLKQGSLQSIKGGVTVVQVRDKEVDTQEVRRMFSLSAHFWVDNNFQFIHIAALSKSICDKYDIPLLINDRVDVALAVNADGVHLGQTDMTVEQARKLLPPGAIIGVSCNNVDQVREAIRNGADYIGIGAVWSTQTKKLTSPVIGVRGVGRMLEELDGTNIKAVAIGASIPTYQPNPFSSFTRWYQINQPSQDFTRNCFPHKSCPWWSCNRVGHRHITWTSICCWNPSGHHFAISPKLSSAPSRIRWIPSGSWTYDPQFHRWSSAIPDERNQEEEPLGSSSLLHLSAVRSLECYEWQTR